MRSRYSIIYTQVGLKPGQSRLGQIVCAKSALSCVYLPDDFTATERASGPSGLFNSETNLNPPMAASRLRRSLYCF